MGWDTGDSEEEFDMSTSRSKKARLFHRCYFFSHTLFVRSFTLVMDWNQCTKTNPENGPGQNIHKDLCFAL